MKTMKIKLLETTKRIERTRAILILEDLVKAKMGYATSLDETSRLQSLIKEFKEELNGKKY